MLMYGKDNLHKMEDGIMNWELHSGGRVRILCNEESEAVRIVARRI